MASSGRVATDILSKEKEEAYTAAFGEFDKDKTGFVTAGELAAVLKDIGWRSDRKTAASMLEEADLDHDGKVTLSEFLTMMAAADPDPKDELLNAFRTFDKDGSGFITTAEFQETMEVQGHKRMSMKTVESIVAEADTNKDGKIDYNEFVAAMT